MLSPRAQILFVAIVSATAVAGYCTYLGANGGEGGRAHTPEGLGADTGRATFPGTPALSRAPLSAASDGAAIDSASVSSGTEAESFEKIEREEVDALFADPTRSAFAVRGTEKIDNLPTRELFVSHMDARLSAVRNKSVQYVLERVPDEFREAFPDELRLLEEAQLVDPTQTVEAVLPVLSQQDLKRVYTESPEVRERFYKLEELDIYTTVIRGYGFQASLDYHKGMSHKDILSYLSDYRPLIERDLPESADLWNRIETYGRMVLDEVDGLAPEGPKQSAILFKGIGSDFFDRKKQLELELWGLADHQLAPSSDSPVTTPFDFYFRLRQTLVRFEVEEARAAALACEPAGEESLHASGG